MNAWNEKHWIKPELVEQPELMQVKLTLYFENDPISGVKDGVKDGVKELSEVQRAIVDEVRRNPSITTNEMAQKTGVKFRTLQRYISQLRTLGILVREGGRKDGYWMVGKMGY
ncbi:MAG: winged helix-turn-helix transcriptional regulator [Parabacteroides sp.]|nr:winged helix-turn-helix transcriptional regulator [Parabacteroides sp.]